MAKGDLLRKPRVAKVQSGSGAAWWYEESHGITVIVASHDVKGVYQPSTPSPPSQENHDGE